MSIPKWTIYIPASKVQGTSWEERQSRREARAGERVEGRGVCLLGVSAVERELSTAVITTQNLHTIGPATFYCGEGRGSGGPAPSEDLQEVYGSWGRERHFLTWWLVVCSLLYIFHVPTTSLLIDSPVRNLK